VKYGASRKSGTALYGSPERAGSPPSPWRVSAMRSRSLAWLRTPRPRAAALSVPLPVRRVRAALPA